MSKNSGRDRSSAPPNKGWLSHDEQRRSVAARIGSVVHRSLGLAYGVTAAALARTGTGPVRAGITAGTAAFLLVDEGVVGTVFTPPPWAYPIESHLRGAVGHLACGAAAGAMLAVARGLGAMK